MSSKRLASLAGALIVGACASVPEQPGTQPAGKLAVSQVGTWQNAELVFCETGKCPQRTQKYLPPAPPPPPAAQIPAVVPAKTRETPAPVTYKVHFRWGWGRLDTAGHRELDEVVATGILDRAKTIVVAGRTDPTGSLKYNEKLAIRRAETVRAALVRAGVPPERVVATAQSPCCNGDPGAGKRVMQALRRTDIDITITAN